MTVLYKVITIYTCEGVMWQGKPVYEALIEHFRKIKLAGRCIVSKGLAGYYENGEVALHSPLEFTIHMPLKIEIVLPSNEAALIIPRIEEMVSDGVVAVAPLPVSSYKSNREFIPSRLRVEAIMTKDVATVAPLATAEEVVRKMLETNLKSFPVVDAVDKVIGIITQENLISMFSLPRISLLAKLEKDKVEKYLNRLPLFAARELMSKPVKTVRDNLFLADAIQFMLKNGLKRVPVVDGEGVLLGVLSRIDIFRLITRESGQWHGLTEEEAFITSSKVIRDVKHRDMDTVLPDVPVTEVVNLLHHQNVQRVVVVDAERQLLGLITDSDLITIMNEHTDSLGEVFVRKLSGVVKGRQFQEWLEKMQVKTARDIMHKNVITVTENTPLEEAVRIMTEKALKRLPVVDEMGRFQGMVSRDAILRTIMQ